mmetsp:Transcript_25086/g.81097  ORF Transcript_25086/g.81097 Transcript_25086/m.81097 type:complete len:296 (-) Transcript_25086:4298-5185(-)
MCHLHAGATPRRCCQRTEAFWCLADSTRASATMMCTSSMLKRRSGYSRSALAHRPTRAHITRLLSSASRLSLRPRVKMATASRRRISSTSLAAMAVPDRHATSSPTSMCWICSPGPGPRLVTCAAIRRRPGQITPPQSPARRSLCRAAVAGPLARAPQASSMTRTCSTSSPWNGSSHRGSIPRTTTRHRGRSCRPPSGITRLSASRRCRLTSCSFLAARNHRANIATRWPSWTSTPTRGFRRWSLVLRRRRARTRLLPTTLPRATFSSSVDGGRSGSTTYGRSTSPASSARRTPY